VTPSKHKLDKRRLKCTKVLLHLLFFQRVHVNFLLKFLHFALTISPRKQAAAATSASLLAAQPTMRHHWDTEAKLCHCSVLGELPLVHDRISSQILFVYLQCARRVDRGFADPLTIEWIIWILRKTIVLIKWPLDQSWTYICDLGAAICSLAYKGANKVNNKLGGTVVGIT